MHLMEAHPEAGRPGQDPKTIADSEPAPTAAWLTALDLRERQLVELLALWQGEIHLAAVQTLLGLSPVPFRGKVLHGTRMHKSLEAMPAGTLRETRSGILTWSNPQRRRQALQSFRTSGRAALWAYDLASLLGRREFNLFRAHGLQTYQGLLRAVLLGGASWAPTAAAFRARYFSWTPEEPAASGTELLAIGAQPDWLAADVRRPALQRLLRHELRQPGADTAAWRRHTQLLAADDAAALRDELVDHELLACAGADYPGQVEGSPLPGLPLPLRDAAAVALGAVTAAAALPVLDAARRQTPFNAARPWSRQ
jgi:hypothetical protein